MYRLRVWAAVGLIVAGIGVAACTGPTAPADTPPPSAAATPTPPARRVIDGGEDTVPWMAWSADGQTLGISSGKNTYQIRDTAGLSIQKEMSDSNLGFARGSAFSPNGRLVSVDQLHPQVGADGQELAIWDWQTGKLVTKINPSVAGEFSWLVVQAWSQDGSTLAYWNSPLKQVQFWVDPQAGKTAPEPITVADFDASDMQWLPDGTLMMAGTVYEDSYVAVWRSTAPEKFDSIPSSVGYKPDNPISLSADGTRIVFFDADLNAAVWDVDSMQRLQNIPVTRDYALELQISPDGALVAAADRSVISVWDVATGGEIATFDLEQSSYVFGLSFSPDSQSLAAGSRHSFLVWYIPAIRQPPATATPIASPTPQPTFEAGVTSASKLVPTQEPVNGQVYSRFSNMQWLDDQTLRLSRMIDLEDVVSGGFLTQDIDVDSASLRVIRTSEPTQGIYQEISPDGSLSTDFNGRESSAAHTTDIHDTASGRTLYSLPFDRFDACCEWQWSLDSRRFYIRTQTTIEVYDARSGSLLASLPGGTAKSYFDSLDQSPDGKWIAEVDVTGSADNVYIWDTQTLKEVYKLAISPGTAYEDTVGDITWSPDSKYLAMKRGRQIDLLDTESMKITQTYVPKNGYIRMIFNDYGPTWSPDSAWVLSRAGEDILQGQNLFLGWNINTGEQRVLMVYPQEAGTRSTSVWNPAHLWLATTDSNESVFVMDIEANSVIRLDGNFDEDRASLKWSPDGNHLAWLGRQGKLLIWTFGEN